MRLPNAEKAYIPPRKLLDYLLSPSHPVGGPKARYFRSVGFDDANVSTLERGLLEIALYGDVAEVEQTKQGMKCAVERIRTLWIIDAGGESPRSVTAYPA